MKKVVMIMHSLRSSGGIQKVNIDIAAGMDGVDLTIISLYPREDDFFDDIIKKNNIKVIYLDKHPGVDLSMIGKLYKLFRKIKPDVIHINQKMTSYSMLPMVLTGIKKRYYVVHNMADKDARGLAQKINRFAFKHLHVTPVAISDICRRSISEVYGIAEEKIPCIYNGVDTERFTRKTPRNSENCTFITVCAYRKQKNLPLLVKAFARVQKEVPDAKLIIVGGPTEGEEYPVEKFKKLIEDLRANVELAGRQSDIPAWLEKGDVYVLSSDYEGLPISVLEAMSMELPVVATRAGGVPDIVKDNGFIVNIGDEAGLADAMTRLAKNPKMRQLFSERSKEMSENYSIRECIKKYKELYLK